MQVNTLLPWFQLLSKGIQGRMEEQVVKEWAPFVGGGIMAGGALMYYQRFHETNKRLFELEKREIALQAELKTISEIRATEKTNYDANAQQVHTLLAKEKQMVESLQAAESAKSRVQLEQLYWVDQITAMQDRIYRLEAELNGLPIAPIHIPQPPTAGLAHLGPDMRSQYDYYRRKNIRILEVSEEE